MDKEHIDVFQKHNVLSRTELQARTEILLEAYSMSINIEALTMLNIAKRQILPAAVRYLDRLASAVTNIISAGADPKTPRTMLEKTSGLVETLEKEIPQLQKSTEKAYQMKDLTKQAELYRDLVVDAMNCVRQAADELESIVDADLWPLPTYAEMLFLK